MEKPKVEDGIFGTSGGIGFTKQNELFVGRVAMIGFAVSQYCPVLKIWFDLLAYIRVSMISFLSVI